MYRRGPARVQQPGEGEHAPPEVGREDARGARRAKAGVRRHRKGESARVVGRGGRGAVLLEAILHALKLRVASLCLLLAVRLLLVAVLAHRLVALCVQAVETD